MLSTAPAFSFLEPGTVNHFSDFQTGFTPWEWDCFDLFSVNQLSIEPAVPSPCYGESDSGLVKTKSNSSDIRTGSDKSGVVFTENKPGFDDAVSSQRLPCTQADKPDPDNPKQCTAIDEKKRKRMESNRESARRSRIRKQSHIDNLRNQVNQLDHENRELGNRLRLVIYQLQRVNTDNNRLVVEQEMLRLRFSEMKRILILRQLQQQQQWELSNRRMIMPEPNPSSIIHHMI